MRDGRKLTPREREIAALVSEGFRDTEIGERLGITGGTVNVHLQAAYRKAGVRNRTELAVWWIRQAEAVS